MKNQLFKSKKFEKKKKQINLGKQIKVVGNEPLIYFQD